MWQRTFDENAVAACRGKIRLAFQALRRQGIRARANYKCCMTCATSALDVKNKLGGVYWHRQSDAGLKESGKLHIGFFTQTGKRALEVGIKLNAALVAQGLQTKWNNDSGTKVLVYAEGAKPEKDD